MAPDLPGDRCNALRWLQHQVQARSRALPRSFPTLAAWETFRDRVRAELTQTIGLPSWPEPTGSSVRGRTAVGQGLVVERVDVAVDQAYAIPAFVFSPAEPGQGRPGLVYNPGWPQSKFDAAAQQFCARMASHGWVALVLDHAPFGETSPAGDKPQTNMTLAMGMGQVLGISQLALRAAETIQCGRYLRARADVDPSRVAVCGLCQGAMDTWLSAALDDGFCAAAPLCGASTFETHFAEMGSYHANSDASPFPFGILKVCDVDHLHACIAPRPLLVRANLPDVHWPVSGLQAIAELAGRVYALYDAADRLDIGAEVHAHNVTGPLADAAESFLLKWV